MTKSVKRQASFLPMRTALQSYGLLVLVYILLIFVLPTSKLVMSTYNLDASSYRILEFSVNLPSILVWFAAFYGYAKLSGYAKTLGSSPEGHDYGQIAKGCAWLAWSLPLPSIISLILNAIAYQHVGFHAASIIISNYIALILPLVGFVYISSGSRGLVSRAKLHIGLDDTRFLILAFVAASAVYCYLTFRYINLSSLSSTNNPYYLPTWLMVVTVVIPYLYAWFVGLLAASEISNFRKQVSGLLYRQALQLLAIGLVAVIISSIALQYIESVLPRSGYLLLNNRLLFVYLFRVIGGIGYVTLAFGVGRLKKIEDV